MQDRPTIEELLDAVEGFLRDTAVPLLDGQPSFHARVAANAVAIVRRELAQDDELAAAEVERLRGLLDAEGGRERLNEMLTGRLRAGMTDPDGSVLDHLRRTAEEKLAVANPKYRGEA